MYNKVVLLGRLTKEIDMRYTTTGTAVANTGIAVNNRWKNNRGEEKEEVLFIDITLYGKRGETAVKYLKKGSKVLIEGRLLFKQWVAQDGTKQSKHDVVVENFVMLDSKDEKENKEERKEDNEQKKQEQQKQQKQIPDIGVDEEDIPF